MSEATATAPARLASTTKKKAGRPATRLAAVAPTEDVIPVAISPEDRTALTIWAEAKGTTPEALVEAAAATFIEVVKVNVAEYLRDRAEFDRAAVARIEQQGRRD